MHRIFQNFIDRLSLGANSYDLRGAMSEAAAGLELNCFAYLCMPRQRREAPRLISTYPPAWTAQYLQKHYERVDPVIARALSDPEPFTWGMGSGSEGMSSVQRELLDDAAQYGIRCGFTIPIHDGRGPICAVTFAADERLAEFQSCINQHGRVLQLMAICFHAHVRPKLVLERTIDGVSLSPREFECLDWAAQGKTAWEISRILKISRRTAAFHLDNAKAKLGVHSVCHAVAHLTASKSTMR